MITLLGIAHVINIRKAIERIIKHRKPDIICIELDRQRYEALRSGETMEDSPLLYRCLSGFQRKIAAKYSTTVGDEMLAAADMAKEMRLPLAFIDVPTAADGKNILDSLSLKEKAMLVLSAFGGMFLGKKRIERELENFQENPEIYMAEMEKRFPKIKHHLIDHRDDFMGGNILTLSRRYTHVLAVVGDGHIGGLSKRLAGEDPRIVRLESIRKMMKDDGTINEANARKYGFPPFDDRDGTNSTASYSFSIEV